MGTRKADVAELIAMRIGLDAERAGQPLRRSDSGAKVPTVWRQLIDLTHDPDPNLRNWAVGILSDGSPVRYRREVLSRLEMLSEDCDGRVRRSARAALESWFRKAQSKLL